MGRLRSAWEIATFWFQQWRYVCDEAGYILGTTVFLIALAWSGMALGVVPDEQPEPPDWLDDVGSSE